MEAFLRHQESVRVQGCHQGIFWWLIRFFDRHQRFRLGKLFVERKRIRGSKTSSDGCKNQPLVRNPSGGEQLRFLLKEADDPMEDKKSSKWSSLKSLMLKKMSKKLSRKKKKIPPASQLQNTISTNSMERSDFNALFEVLTTCGDASAPLGVDSTVSTRKKSEVCNSFKAASCGGPNQIKKIGNQFLKNQAVLMEKLAKANVLMKDANNEKQGQGIVVYKASDFADVLELLNANAELFCKMFRDPSFGGADNAVDQGSSGVDSLMKCGSFPGSTRGKSCGFSRFKLVGEGVQNSFRLDGTDSVPRHKDFRQRIKDVIKDSKDEGARLSLDGVLHKIPLGHDVTEDRTASDRNLRARKYGFPHKDNNTGYQGFRRSRSVTSDPFDKYARLFESSSSGDSRRLATGSKPSFREGAMPDENPARRWGRTVSNPEFVRSLDRFGVEEPLSIYEHSVKKSSATPDRIPCQNFDLYMYEQLPSIEEATHDTEDEDPRQLEATIHRGHQRENANDYSDEAIGCSDPATLIVNEEFEFPNGLETEEGGCVFSPERHEHKEAKPSPVSVLDCSHQELDFVTDLMIDYGGGDEFPSSWRLEAGDVEGSPGLLRLAGDWLDLAADRRLLGDLINEVLLETYACSSSFRHGFPGSRRPTPAGCRALERVWASVSRLASQSRMNPTFEHAAAQDLSKQDEWLNIREGMDVLGLELEAWILDDMLCDAFSS